MTRNSQVKIAHQASPHAINRLKPPTRFAFTVAELIVSSAVLITIMTFSTTIFIQTQKIWQDIRQQRIATCELSNQLDRLTRLTREQVERELPLLQPSLICSDGISKPELMGRLTEDSMGMRITLSLEWKRRHGGKPLTLSAWLNPATNPDNSEERP